MTKTKARLRAEAVERLRARKEEGSFIEHIELYAILLDSTPEEVLKIPNCEVTDGIIDLLTDDCGPCYACAKLAELRAENNALRGIVGDLKAPTDPGEASMMSVDAFIKKQTEHESLDTREKLEADVRKLLYDVWTEGWELGSRDAIGGKDRMCDALVLLDRQASITEYTAGIAAKEASMAMRETIAELREDVAERDDVIAVLKAENADLQAKLDELAERKCPGYEPESHHCRYHHQDFELNHQTVSRLKRENAELARDLGECMAERDELIAEIDALEYQGELDEPRCTKVDMDGEVVG